MSEKLSFGHVSYFGAGRLLIPQNHSMGLTTEKYSDDMVLVPYLEADIIDRSIRSKIKPEWWREAVQQAEEVRRTRGRPLIVRFPDNSYCLTGRYLESFWQWLHTIDNDGISYDRHIGGIIVESPVWTTETNTVLFDVGIMSSGVASTYISPETEQAKQLRIMADEATKRGFRVPDPRRFPTSRTLMKHQVPVTLTMAMNNGGILADEVGSGKSAMLTTGFLSLVQWRIEVMGHTDESDMWPLVIVTKKSLIPAAEKECSLWFKGCHTHVLKGKNSPDIPEGTHFVLCTPTVLHSRIDDIIAARPAGAVFDESHMFKNPNTQRSKAALKLSQWVRENNEYPYVMCVSGTPMPNNPSELWTQLELANMDEEIVKHMESVQTFPRRTRFSLRNSRTVPVSNRMKFEMRYCNGRPGPFGWDARGHEHEYELASLLRNSKYVRRKKSEFITPLPLLYQGFVRCDISPEDRARYDRAEQKFRDHLVLSMRKKAKKEKWSKSQLRYEINDKLRKSSTSEAIMKMTEIRKIAGEIKVDAIVDWVHRFFAADPNIVGRDKDRTKLIIFAHHKDVQKQLIEHPDLQQYGVLSIVAGTKNVNDIVDEFQDKKSGKNIIVLYSEAREGLTLTAAKDVLVAEMPFVPSWLIQMGGRCWARVSELYPPHEAHLHYAVADVGIDAYLEEIIRKKGWLQRVIIDGERAADTINTAESGEVEDDSVESSVIEAIMNDRK